MADPDGRTHSPVCWRGHEDCAERLLSEAADVLDGMIETLTHYDEHVSKDERNLVARLRAALEDT